MIWTAFSRRKNRVVAYHVGDKGVTSAMTIYQPTKQAVGRIAQIYTDANSCYALPRPPLGGEVAPRSGDGEGVPPTFETYSG